jgi:N-glycosidase YbiA
MIQHQAIRGFFGPFRFLSNFVPCRVLLDDLEFASTEHAYVAAKTLDIEERNRIAAVQTAGQVKRLGRKLKLRDDWDQVKDAVMLDLLIQKFAQEPFKSQLLATGNAYLEETNTWNDTYWGVCNGVGYNTLGQLLMQVRSDLQELTDR